ncbi:DUF418 domain-containing protein [Pseudonocardia sp. KRD291]|uniref:DUF418 domain-containing protein n=1 Tax=Pseudonocardia sp. KRD291 TaxID=2792007 RepID=UPI001C49E457|nr:DUF418 domain-containing protein [Pseudonocardia sp. KRD291]MBW0105064.1 DUF418 domain-containing protein [Pseudonocardia sp. KRD291]
MSDSGARASTGTVPDPARSRIPTLDVLRGLAILGTFASNVWLFAAPGGPASLLGGERAAGLAPGPAAVETFLRFLANGKFLALLTLLFGVGMELQYRAAVRRGLRWPGRYLLRAGLLLVEGLLHYVLVFEFDVLMGYAVTSVVVAYLIGRSDRARTAAIAVAVTVQVLLVALLTAAPGGPSVDLPPAPVDYLGQVAMRMEHWGVFRAEIVLIVPSGVALFLIGARLLRAGAFGPDGTRIRRRMMLVGACGLPLNLLTSFAGPRWFLVDRYLCAPLVAVGLAAAVTASVFGLRTGAGPLRRGLTAVGRTAMSCYVLQNVVGSALCYPWGLGLAATAAEAGGWTRVLWVPLLWAVVCAGFTSGAVLWLRRFDRGPLELVMHRAMGARPPLRG